jgi:hypothetical protein
MEITENANVQSNDCLILHLKMDIRLQMVTLVVVVICLGRYSQDGGEIAVRKSSSAIGQHSH